MIGTLPSIIPKLTMVVSRRYSPPGGRTGPSAVMPPNSNRGGRPPTVDKPHCNGTTCSNPQGRLAADIGRLKTRRVMLKIGAWKVRTLNKPGRYDNLKREMKTMQLDILVIAETRWTGDGILEDETYMMIYSRGEKH